MFVKILFILFLTLGIANSQLKNYISIYLYTQSNPALGHTVDLSNSAQLTSAGFSKNKDSVFLFHGYLERPKSITLRSSSQSWKNDILSKHDVNVFVVDYSALSSGLYPSAVQEVVPIGSTVASLVKDMVKNSGLDLKKTKMVGISLGAQVAGVTGNHLGGNVEQIVGVDPAGPLFSIQNPSNRLSKSSAEFVQVIHTCGGRFGMYEPLGHADYYVNGGRSQPSCGIDQVGLCSHILSATYYTESLKTAKFIAKKCGDYERFKRKMCTYGKESIMGGYKVDKRASGIYFLDTNISPPYAKG